VDGKGHNKQRTRDQAGIADKLETPDHRDRFNSGVIPADSQAAAQELETTP
jgi:hypothetical protein